MTILPSCDVITCKKPADKNINGRPLCGEHSLEMVATGEIKDDYAAEISPDHLFNGA